MKKLVLSAAAFALTASNFVGLTNVHAQDKVALDLAVLEGGYGAEVWPAIVEAYKEVNPNVEITLTQEKELEDALTPRFQAGDAPDVVMLGLGRAKAFPETLIKEKALADLTDVLDLTIPGEEGTVKDKLLPNFTDSTATNPYGDGKTYLMPMFYSPTGLFYNKGLFAEKGWEVPTTWDGMWELAEKAKAEGIALFTYPTAGYLDTFFYSNIYNAGGQELFNQAMNYEPEVWGGEDLKAVFETLGKLAQETEGTTVANANKDGFTKNQQLILDNKALFMPNGTWIVGEMKEAPRAEGFEWGMTAVPAIKEGGDRHAYTFVEQVWVPEAAEQKEAAKEFVAFLYSDKAAEVFANHGAVQPIKGLSEKLPAEQQVFYNIYNDGVLPGMGNFVAAEAIEGADLKGTLTGTFDAVVSGDTTVEEWQASLVELVTQFHESLVH
ncbi:MAG: carbohydrate ABC transporter substrate-binding protein [Aerococcaceae bacterium]|nr:carbohydrate ABC transporter substrate-binding protein [Aerococcaceae bacterium]